MLPLAPGYPAHWIVSGQYGMESAKWVGGIRPTRVVVADWYGTLGWSKDATVQTMTLIDTAANGQALADGLQPGDGVSYAGARGVSRGERSADGGRTWRSHASRRPSRHGRLGPLAGNIHDAARRLAASTEPVPPDHLVDPDPAERRHRSLHDHGPSAVIDLVPTPGAQRRGAPGGAGSASTKKLTRLPGPLPTRASTTYSPGPGRGT